MKAVLLANHRAFNINTMKTPRLTSVWLAMALVSLGWAGEPAPPAPTPVAPAPAQNSFFTGVEGGFFWLQDETLSIGSLKPDVNFHTGWGVTVPLGYDLGNGFSASLSAGYYHTDIYSLALGRDISHSVGGDATLVPLMANGSYKIPIAGALSAYIGGGVGAVYSENTLETPRHSFSDDSWDFGLQAFTGLSYDICAFSSVRLGYRYTHVFRSEGDQNGHGLELGVMLRF